MGWFMGQSVTSTDRAVQALPLLESGIRKDDTNKQLTMS